MLDHILSKRRSGQLGNPANYAMRRIASFARRVPSQGGESFESLESMLQAIDTYAPSVSAATTVIVVLMALRVCVEVGKADWSLAAGLH